MEVDPAENLAVWQKSNNDFLAAALTWLRAKLRQRIQEQEPAGEPPEQRRWQPFMARKPVSVKKEGDLEKEVEKARQKMEAAAATNPPPALRLLGQLVGLTPYEQDILLMCAAVELAPDIAGWYAELPGKQPYPSFALARLLFDDPAWDALSPERSLRYYHLIEINQPAAQPLTTSPLRADERIVSYLKGLNYLDDRLTPLLVPLDPAAMDPSSLADTQRYMAETVHLYVGQAYSSGSGMILVQLTGADGLSKQMAAFQAIQNLDPPVHLLRLPAIWLPTHADELENLARLWERERILLHLGLYLDAGDTSDGTNPEGQAPPLQRFLGRIGGVVFLDTREVRPELGQSILSIDAGKPTAYEQSRAWQNALNLTDPAWPARLAGQFNLNFPTIYQVAALAAVDLQPELEPAQDPAGSKPGERAWQICLNRTRPQLEQLAHYIEPKAEWENLELPEETKGLLDEICGQVEQRLRVYDEWGLRAVMNRGLGISALFSGESGTGKTFAAEVIAKRLNLNLFRIDLSAVVSKYIGETEKNLRRLFDAAETGGVILFFDEADALFGKRSEVKDSHDRYANIEVNYLLQRMEGYGGLAILATNMKSALDQAFTRRLRFIVNFPFPGVDWRKRIWMGAFPPGIPLDTLDYDRLSRFNQTGGSIRNAAVNAAFLAAGHAGPVVTMDIVLQAVREEMRKLEKPVVESDFILKLSEPDRAALWGKAFGPDAPWKNGIRGGVPTIPLEAINYSRLARFDLAPSSIYDTAAQAVMSAASHIPPSVKYADVLALACDRLKMLGKTVNEEDCRP